MIMINYYFTTIVSSTSLEIEFKIDFGTGYNLVSQTPLKEDTNFLELDSVYMPIQTVNFKIENIYHLNNIVTER